MGSIKGLFNRNNLSKVVYLIPAIVIVLLTFNRLFYGSEISDEAFNLAIPKAFLAGTPPFYGNWDLAQTSAFFMVPPLFLFSLFNGGFEGAMLFSRIIFFIFTLVVAGVGYYSTSLYLNKILSVYISLILVTYAPFALYNASYNSLTYSFLLLGLFFLMIAFSDKYKDGAAKIQRWKGIFILLAGVSHAFLAFYYPTMVALSILVGLVVVPRVIYLDSGFTGIIKLWIHYIVGGAIAGLTLFGILLLASGGLSNVLSGIDGMFLNTLYGDSGLSLSLITSIPESILGALQWQNLEFIVCVFIFAIFLMYKIKNKMPPVYSALIFTPVLALYYIWFVYGTKSTHSQIDIVFLLGGILPAGLYFLTTENKALFSRFYTLLYLPSLFGFFLVSGSSAGTFIQGPWIMIGGVLLSVICIMLLLKETTNKHLVFTMQLSACVLFCLVNVFLHYSVVYRDAPVRELNYTVGSGVYKGIRTTYERKVLLETTEGAIKSIDREGKKMMAMENVPFVYLMSDMQPSVPSIWSTTFYYAGSTDTTQVMAFYDDENRMPDVVFFFYPSDFGYGNDPDYALHAWLWENYVLTQDFTDTPNVMPFWVFERARN